MRERNHTHHDAVLFGAKVRFRLERSNIRPPPVARPPRPVFPRGCRRGWSRQEFVMRVVLGLLLIMLTLATYFVWMPQTDIDRELAVISDVIAQRPVQKASPAVDPPNRGMRTFSPS